MKKRLIVLLVFLALAALVAGVAAIYYAVSARQLAVRQAAFRARGSAALQHVASLLPGQTGMDSTGSTPPRATPPISASLTSITQEATPRQSTTRPRRAPAPPDTPRRGLDQLDLDTRQYSQDLSPICTMWPVMMAVDLKEGDLDTQGALTAAGRQKARGEVRKRLIEVEASNRLDSRRKKARKRLEDLSRTLPTSPLPDFLARMEDVLLSADWALPDYADYFHSVYASSFPIKTFANLAILRSALRGDGARAGLLWLKQLEYLRGRYLATYPKVITVLDAEFSQALFTLGELKQIPGESLGQAARLLASMQPTAEQAADLRQAHALRWVNYMSADEYAPPGQPPIVDFRFNQNSLHFLQIHGVGFDTLCYRLNRPKMNQYLHDYAAAWVDGRRDAMKTAEDKYVALARVCNLKTDGLRSQLEDIDDSGEYYFSFSLALARLVLAAERYRRDTGQFPASDADLGSRYIDPPLEATSTTGHLVRLDAFEAKLVGGETVAFPARPVFYSGRELSEEDYLFPSGTRERRLFRLTVVVPRFPDTWRDELDLIKRIGAPIEPAAPAANANSTKKFSNQTSATALKK